LFRSFAVLKRNYDTIAWFYDRLAGLVFGRTLVNAQLYLVSSIPAGSRILIVGGGTGWILEKIAAQHPSGLKITYIDASAKMIALAVKRKCGDNHVLFIAQGIETVMLAGAFDVVITPFLFDNFTDNSLRKIFADIDSLLKTKGLWLYCDFQNTTVLWQRAVLRVMYWFFRGSCGIEATHLPDAKACFAEHGYIVMSRRDFMNGFVTAVMYNK